MECSGLEHSEAMCDAKALKHAKALSKMTQRYSTRTKVHDARR